MAANYRKRAMHNEQYWVLKALANEDTHCCGHIDAYDVSWTRKSAGHKMNLVRTQNVSEQNQKLFVSASKSVLRARANGETFVSATMYRLPGPLATVLSRKLFFSSSATF